MSAITTDLTPDPSAYKGYLRVDHGPWQLVCSGVTADICWTLLQAHPTPADARAVGRLVLPKGLDPNAKKPRRCSRGS
jgi:hypothetical protein